MTLEIDELPSAIRAEVAQLASEVGLSTKELADQTAALSPSAQLRLRVGRALALRPRVVLAEHPNAELAGTELSKFARDFAVVVRRRGIAALVITADAGFASAVANRVLEFQASTGALLEKKSGWRRWFS